MNLEPCRRVCFKRRSCCSLFQVSVLVLKMNEVNCGIEARGDDLSVALQVMNVVPEQLSNVGMWQYLRGYLGKMLAPGVFYNWLSCCPRSGDVPFALVLQC